MFGVAMPPTVKFAGATGPTNVLGVPSANLILPETNETSTVPPVYAPFVQ